MEDQKIAEIQQEIAPIVEKSEEIALIKSAEDEARAVEFLSQVAKRVKIIETARTTLVKPLNDHVKMINEKFKETLAPLTAVQDHVRKGMIEWRKSEDVRLAEEKRISLEQEASLAVKIGDTQAVKEIAEEHAQASVLAPKIVHTMTGSAHFREVARFEIENVDEIPREFLQPDEAKIKAAVSAGATIPGIKSWKEKVPVIR